MNLRAFHIGLNMIPVCSFDQIVKITQLGKVQAEDSRVLPIPTTCHSKDVSLAAGWKCHPVEVGLLW